MRRRSYSLTVIITVVVLSVVTTTLFVSHEGMASVLKPYDRGLEVQSGASVAPFQYRLLTEIALVGFTNATSFPLGIMMFMLLLLTWMYASVALYLKALGATDVERLVGLSILMWACTQGVNSLGLNSLTEIALYAIGLYAIRTRRDAWILPITILGALNRETIVFLSLGYALIRGTEYYRARSVAAARRLPRVLRLPTRR